VFCALLNPDAVPITIRCGYSVSGEGEREWVLVASEEATDRFADVSDASLERGRFLVGCWFAVSLCVTVSFDEFVQCWRVELFEIVHVCRA
jgi:hypothetical protein